MTSGAGLSHGEEFSSRHRQTRHGVQLLVALPEVTRYSVPKFAHFDNLPRFEMGASAATLLIGEMFGTTSPARHDTPVVGMDLSVDGVLEIELRTDFEYAVLPLNDALNIDGRRVALDELAYLKTDRDHVQLSVVLGRSCLEGRPFRSRS